MDSDEPARENNADKRLYRINASEEIDSKYGFLKHRTSVEKIGWLVNFQPVNLKKIYLFVYILVNEYFFVFLTIFRLSF